ncbi:MAG TPA: YggS family pyridoxal phosphate-dependent enzyme [Longimicrobiales bacterium]|nr:YggS family pyridoxal phosphate-dependent enzyme [Longimicrobiales bacterium]
MTYEDRLRAALPRVQEEIAAAGSRAGRREDVVILPVTKGHPAAAVAAVAAVGLGRAGENRVQELERKRAELGARVEWHLIGHLQRNKAKKALSLFDVIHSLDSARLADELSAAAQRAGLVVRAFVQVNASGEGTKGGFERDEAPDEVARMAALPGLSIEGLMTMAPYTDDEVVLRRCFATTRTLLGQCVAAAPGIGRALSMGMSNDFALAVEEGSTIVRLGTVLLGERST